MQTEPTDMKGLISLANAMSMRFDMHATGKTRDEVLVLRRERRDAYESEAAAYEARFDSAPKSFARHARTIPKTGICECCGHAEPYRMIAYDCPLCGTTHEGISHPRYSIEPEPGMRSDFLCSCGIRVQLSEATAAMLEAQHHDD